MSTRNCSRHKEIEIESVCIYVCVLFSVQGDDMYNLNLAFEVAEKHLDIPKMLDAEGEHRTIQQCVRCVCVRCVCVCVAEV